MITINNILGRMTVDYDDITFWFRGDSLSYNELVSNFDLDHIALYNMFLDPITGAINIDFVRTDYDA